MDVMLDVETLGKKPGCAIVQIAAALFDIKGIHQTREWNISLESNAELGLIAEMETLEFWMVKQPDEIRRKVIHPRNECTSLDDAMVELYHFINRNVVERVWVRGPTFDIPILEHIYDKMRAKGSTRGYPWRYSRIRDVRTVLDLLQIEKTQGDHTAMQDVVSQCADIITAFKIIEGTEIKNV